MMKIFSTLFFVGFFVQLAYAQPLPNYLQTTTFGTITALNESDGGSGNGGNLNFMGGGGGGFGDSKLFSEYDSQGNICSAGVFLNEVDFNPGVGVQSFTATGNDGFIQKLSPDGVLLWAVSFPGPGGFGVTDIAIDQFDNIYASVYFNGTVDLDPGAGEVLYTSAGTFNNSALVKINANGELIWAKHFSNNSNELSGKITLDEISGAVYVTGVFMGTTDFDPGAGTASSTSGGSWDGYMVILNTDGDYLSHVFLGVTGFDSIGKVLFDNFGNLYMVGTFAGTVDFDFTIGVSTLTSGLGQANTFFAKYSSDGVLIWVKMLGGAFTSATGMCLDNEGNLYYSSSMTSGSVDVDPGPNTVTYANPNGGALIVKLTTDGDYLGHAGLSGSPHTITGIHVFSNGNLFVHGYFGGTVDFNPGAETNEFTAAANQEFIWMLNSQLEYFNVFTRPGTWPISLRIEGVKLIVSGVFTGSVDFDPASGTDTQMAGDLYSFYISEFDFCQNPTFGSVDISSCGNYTSPSGLIFTSSGVYTDTIPNSIGCDSIITINLTHSVPLSPSVEISTPTNTICQGDLAEITASPVNGGNNPTYQWLVNDAVYDINQPVVNSLAIFDQDEIRVIMTSSEGCLTQVSDTSDVIIFTVGNPGGTAEIFVTASPSNILCSADTVTFTGTVFNPGYNPVYTWTVNGVPTGGNSPELVLANPADNAVVVCSIVSSDICLISGSDLSDAITLDVTQSMIPLVVINGPEEICPGVEVIFEAGLTDEGTNPDINWYLNGSDVPIASGATFTSNSLLDEDVIICVLINNDFCADPVFDISNEITVDVYDGGDPFIEVIPSINEICAGEEINFGTLIENGGNAPQFQWLLNGTPMMDENGPTFSSNALSDQDNVQCSVTSSLGCVINGTALSQPFYVTIHQEALTEITLEKCADEAVIVNGIEYTEPGFYVDSSNVTFFGCDSILHITITNFQAPDLDVITGENLLTAQQAGASYQWLDCNNGLSSIQGATSQSFSPSETGSYAVQIETDGCAYISECVDITIIGVDEKDAHAFVLFPNPADKWIAISLQEGLTSLVIEDMAGRKVFVSYSLQPGTTTISLENLESGVYSMHATDQKGQSQSALFVKE